MRGFFTNAKYSSSLVSSYRQGFSLVELSLIIAVASILAVGFLYWASPNVATDAQAALNTRKTIAKINNAMVIFRIKHGRLPCPADRLMRNDNTRSDGTDNLYDTQFGYENLDRSDKTINGIRTLGVDCPIPIGTVPVYSLGLNKKDMNDGWGRRFTYHISPQLCGHDAGVKKAGNQASEYRGCTVRDYANNIGNITIKNTANSIISYHGAYAIISHGVNGHGAFVASGKQLNTANAGPLELENTDNDLVYIATDYGNDFDDITSFRTRIQLEHFAHATNQQLVDITDCNANSNAIKELDYAQAKQLEQTLNSTSSAGGESTLSMFLAMQQMCVYYFGNKAKVIDKLEWNGPACPGTAQYDTNNNACSCPSGDWSNCQ